MDYENAYMIGNKKSKLLRVVGWTAYALAGVVTSLMFAFSVGAYGMIAWVALLVLAPRLLRII